MSLKPCPDCQQKHATVASAARCAEQKARSRRVVNIEPESDSAARLGITPTADSSA